MTDGTFLAPYSLKTTTAEDLKFILMPGLTPKSENTKFQLLNAHSLITMKLFALKNVTDGIQDYSLWIRAHSPFPGNLTAETLVYLYREEDN